MHQPTVGVHPTHGAQQCVYGKRSSAWSPSWPPQPGPPHWPGRERSPHTPPVRIQYTANAFNINISDSREPGRSVHDVSNLWSRAATGNLTGVTACGKKSSPPGMGCPLNVCCSEFGFCGTTSDFCASPGCQSHCEQPKPKATKTDSQNRIIGYWQSWNTGNDGAPKCGTMAPSEIPVHLLTHLVFSFAFITPSTFEITNATGTPLESFGEITSLKQKNPDLKVIIALGGWTFNDPGPWQLVFHDLASTKVKRAVFIKNLLKFLDCNGFDGVDFDWEYPGAEDRGGRYVCVYPYAWPVPLVQNCYYCLYSMCT